MTTAAVQKTEQATAWQLRSAWGVGRVVRLTLTERCMLATVVGKVSQVSVTGAFAVVDGWSIPCADVRGVGQPTLDDKAFYGAEMRRLRAEQAQYFDADEAGGR